MNIFNILRNIMCFLGIHLYRNAEIHKSRKEVWNYCDNCGKLNTKPSKLTN